ncbi:dTDP-4-dehydrorhamnose 3,5-epimerase family protein [Aeromonas salmonicida]|uniref:dTDP-4-dehydrorhamnose 3,5-epimerase family protein n=1 Tax=Aeromonas salmonicida TaxID=645 RepID=UPI0033906504
MSHSAEGPLRGLSYQRTHPQRKLVQALSGHIFDVAVDVRPASSTYGYWGGISWMHSRMMRRASVGISRYWR